MVGPSGREPGCCRCSKVGLGPPDRAGDGQLWQWLVRRYRLDLVADEAEPVAEVGEPDHTSVFRLGIEHQPGGVLAAIGRVLQVVIHSMLDV